MTLPHNFPILKLTIIKITVKYFNRVDCTVIDIILMSNIV